MVDSPTIDLTLTGSGTAVDPFSLTAAAAISATAGNVLTSDGTGLLVTCESIQDCVGGAFGNGLVYDDAANAMRAKLSTDGGNSAVFGGDGGIFVPAAAASGVVTVLDTPTVDLTLTGNGSVGTPYVVSAAVKVSPAAGNLVTSDANGLLLTCESVQDCVGNAFGNGLVYDDAGNAYRARLSTDAGNSLSFGTDNGIFAPTGGGATVVTQNTNCISMAGNGAGVPLSASPIVDPLAANLLSCTATGLRAVLTTANSNCVTLTGTGAAGSPLTAAPVIDPVVGNLLSCTATGLRAIATPIVSGPCGVQGLGTAASPLTAKVGVWAWPCADTEGEEVYCRASDGRLIVDPPTLTFHDQAFTTSTFANLAVPAGAAALVIASATVNITNPSTCRSAMTMFELEVDIDFNLPAAAAAVAQLNGDAMVRHQNTGGTTQTQVHVQGSKVVPGADLVPGGVAVGVTDGGVSNGAGGATYSRAQVTNRGWAWAINP